MKEYLSQKTTPPIWKKVRNIAGIVAIVGGAVLGAGANLPEWAITLATVITAVAAALSGGAALTKKRDV